MRNKKGQFAPGNSFAKGHGAPKSNQNAKGHGAPARNINAVKHGIYLRWDRGEGPEDRLPPGAGSDVLEVLTGAKKLHDHWARVSYLAGECCIKFAQRPYWK